MRDMKTGVYFCNCGDNIAGKIDGSVVEKKALELHPRIHFRTVGFLCSEDGKTALENDIKEQGIDRVVVAACSPREHESTFMRCLSAAGLNPYLLQMVNIREHVAWVTADPDEGAAKAARLIVAAIRRVQLHASLHKREIDICPDALVIGAGPSGARATLALAAAGRKVTLVEKGPVIGGLLVRHEEIFPALECGPCVLEPLLGEILHGETSDHIELLTLSEVSGLVGSYGNFTVTVRQQPRYVDLATCIGCMECLAPCPVSAKNEFDYGLGERKAIYQPFLGALPNVPVIDPGLCLNLKKEGPSPGAHAPPSTARCGGEERPSGPCGGAETREPRQVDDAEAAGLCTKCQDACPVEGTIRFDEEQRLLTRRAGAMVVAIGGGAYDCSALPALGHGSIPGVVTAAEFERILASNGPTGGEIRTPDGRVPDSIAIIHCVGSLDSNHKEYCSGICCQYAFKFNHLVAKKLPNSQRTHFYKEISVPGKDEFSLYRHAQDDPATTFLRYREISELTLERDGDRIEIRHRDGTVTAGMVILCPASVPAPGTEELAKTLEIGRDRFGFFAELHSRTDVTQSTIKGIAIAGACQFPMDLQRAMSQGISAAGFVLSGLVPGRKLEISPVNAIVDESRCSGCRTCIPVCPYGAISRDEVRGIARINDVLCAGCGTCAAACPSGVIRASHFTNEQIIAEIEGILGKGGHPALRGEERAES